MPGGQLQGLGAGRPDQIADRQRRGRRHDVVLGRHDVEQRPGQVRHGEQPPVQADPVLHERAVAHDLDGVAKGAAREGDVVPGPLPQDLEGLHLLVVPQLLPQHGVLGEVGGRLQHAEGVSDDLGRDVAGLVDDVIRVEAPLVEHPAEHAHLGEVHRGGHGDQRGDRQVGMSGAEQQREHPAEAVADHVDLVGPGGLQHRLDRGRQQLVDVGRQPVARIELVRDAPVEHVRVEALLAQRLHEAGARRQVQDVAAADQAHHDQDGRPDRHAVAAVAPQLGLVTAPDGVLGRHPDFGPVDPRHVLDPVACSQQVSPDVAAHPRHQVVGLGRRRHRILPLLLLIGQPARAGPGSSGTAQAGGRCGPPRPSARADGPGRSPPAG